MMKIGPGTNQYWERGWSRLYKD